MNSDDFVLITTDRIRLNGRMSFPDAEPLGVLCIVHGIGEHMGRYAHAIRYFVDSGFAVLAFDLRGHGKSEGPKAHAPGIDFMLGDIDLAVEKARTISLDAPHFLLGHSMGGNLVLNYVLRRKSQLTGVIVLSPGLRTAVPTPSWKLAVAKALSLIVPTLLLNNGIRAGDLSRDPGIAESVLKDPLYRFLISARLGIDILKAGDWALEHASEFPLPLLLMHGTSDRVTSPDATKEFASKVKVECLLKLRDGFYHELLNEPEKGEVLAYITKWMGRGGKAGLFIQPE